MSPPESAAPSDELVVAIEPDGSGGLRLQVIHPLGGGEAPFRSPFSSDELRRLLPDLERRVRDLQTGAESPPSPASGLSIEGIGRRLFESLAVGDVARSLFTALGRVQEGDSPGLRLRLVMDPTDRGVAEVAALPWELLFDPRHHRYLARSPVTPVVRFLPVSSTRRLRSGHLPLRVLVAFANPRDTDSLGVEREARKIREALAQSTEKVEVETFEAKSAMALLRRLHEGRFHVLHFIGHGDFDTGTGDGRLHFGGSAELAKAVSGRTLASMLEGLASLRLVVLNACDTARFERREGRDPYSGVAHALVRGGVPAVIAMQFPISDRAAIAFSSAVYQALAAGRPVDLAVSQGRQALRVEREDFEWATPALFLQVEDGRILDLRPWPRRWRRDLLTAVAVLLAILAGYGLWWWLDPGFPYRAWLNPPECPSPVALGRDAAMRFVLIEPGSFEMGSDEGEEDERPRHRVEIQRPFCLGMFEVTRRQWWRVMGEEPDPEIDPDLPANRVSFPEARELLRRLNQEEGSHVFRLPTEEEWEYAARAGTTTAYSFGDDPADLPTYGNCLSPDAEDDHQDRTAPVGSFKPNPWGLRDVHGNVQEWVAGPYAPYPGGVLELDLPQLDNRVRRGGSYGNKPEKCRSAARNSFTSDMSYVLNGLRIARDPE
jgi:formylglycine-generating enzyme required for sulfatase activity